MVSELNEASNENGDSLMKVLRKGVENLVGDFFTVGIDLPVTRTPTFEEAVEVGPGKREEVSPFGFYGLWVNTGMLQGEGCTKSFEVIVKNG